jgi:transposase
MGIAGTACASQQTRWPSAKTQPPRDPQRHLLCRSQWWAWKLLPHDLPPWRTVYHYFWFWRRTGVWQQIHDRLREQVREAAGRNPNPSAAILDSQSIRSSEAGGVRGYDAGKKICGRKRHILVDILGLLLLVVVTAANRQGRNGAQLLLAPLAKQFRRLRLIWADGAYAGELETWTPRPVIRKQLVTVRLPGASIAPISSTCACCQTRSENNGAKALNRETNNQGKGVNMTTSGGQSQISRTTFINGQSRA